MNVPIVVDVCIGLFFIYLLYSLLISIFQELIATFFGFRSKILEQGIARMLQDSDIYHSHFRRLLSLFKKSPEEKRKKSGKPVVPLLSINTRETKDAVPKDKREKDPSILALFYSHPHIKYLSQGSFSENASYIKRDTFSKVVIELLSGQSFKTEAKLEKDISQALTDGQFNWGQVRIPDDTLIQLNTLWSSAQGNLQNFKAELESWFDEMMERITGWYKKYTQIILMIISFILVVLFNVDTLQIVDKLENDENLRNQVVSMSTTFVKEHADLEKVYALNGNKPNVPVSVIDTTLSASQTDSVNLQRYDSLAVLRDKYVKLADSLIQVDISKTNGVLGMGIGSFKMTPCDCVKNGKMPANVNSYLHEDCTLFQKTCHYAGCLFKSLIGWMLTTLAISLGAPFWFDILNKLVKLRSSIAPASETKAK